MAPLRDRDRVGDQDGLALVLIVLVVADPRHAPGGVFATALSAALGFSDDHGSPSPFIMFTTAADQAQGNITIAGHADGAPHRQAARHPLRRVISAPVHVQDYPARYAAADGLRRARTCSSTPGSIR
jgi:hypothetical protein